MVGQTGDDIDQAGDRPKTILVEFGHVIEEQQAQVDLHPSRAVGTILPAPLHAHGVVVEFWLRDEETAAEAYDQIRGWAIGNRLPIRGIHGD